MRGGAFVRLVRPVHVVKNLFVLLPAPFAAAAGQTIDAVTLFGGLLAFSLVPAGIYAINDALDVERDRAHPEKRRRPVAAGEVSPRAATILGYLLAGVGLAALTWIADGRALLFSATYFALTLLYCYGGKNIPIVDVLVLTVGFLLRIAIGCSLLAVPPSNWLLVCGSAVALFLALGKRRADLARGLGIEHRPSLTGYSVRGLDIAIGLAVLVTLLSYAEYTRTSPFFLPERRYVGLLFAALGLLTYLRRIWVVGDTRSPVEAVLRSPEIVLALLLYAIATAWSLGVP